jgi:autoinducer 2-degrading protein
MRFDILQSNEESTRFMLYEAYVDENAAKAHKQTAHYARWRDTVAPWMAEPRRGINYTSVKP